MRIKDFWTIFPLPAKLRLVLDRLTLTKTTTIYFVFSILHCVVQMVFQVHAFQGNVRTARFLASVTEQGNAVNPKSFYVFENDLRLCSNSALASFTTSSCQVLWNGTLQEETPRSLSPTEALTVNTVSNTSPSTSSCYHDSALIPTAIEDAQGLDPEKQLCDDRTIVKRMSLNAIGIVESNGTVQVVLNGPGQHQESVTLDRECLLVLGWPVQILRNTEREDLVFILFQIWVLGMSVVAILNESIPHIIATLLTHLVATGWNGFQIVNTTRLRSDFAEVITDGACHSVDLLRAYWKSRVDDEFSSLILNSVALFFSVILCWKLAQSFGWQTFKRIGKSCAISRTYKIVLTLSIVIQLSLFFILTSIALWLDQLWNGAIGRLATWPLYRPFLTVTLILLPLWLAFGWYSVRREHKTLTLVFLAMCCGYLVGWGAMFHSITFRWTYVTWPFFAAMTTASVFLTLLAFVLGIMCRINFGRGLLYYLKDHESVEDGFEAVDPEKVAFPSRKDTIYAIPFGSGIQFPPFPQVSGENVVQPMKATIQISLKEPSRAVTHASPEHTHHPLHQQSFVSSSKTWI